MKPDQFATAINCFDGRAQIPAIDWLKINCNVQYVDLITEPGADNVLVQGSPALVDSIEAKLKLSLRLHQSRVVAIVAHHDCLANPVSREEHWELLRQGVDVIHTWGVQVPIVGLWVNEWGAVDVVCDTRERQTANSYR